MTIDVGPTVPRPDDGLSPGQPFPRPAVLRGATHRTETTLGPVFVTVNETEPGLPFEVLVNAGKAGSDLAGLAEVIGRLCTLCLRLPEGTDPPARLRQIADRLGGSGGTGGPGSAPGQVRPLPTAIARVLAAVAGQETPNGGGAAHHAAAEDLDPCPGCGAPALGDAGVCSTCCACGRAQR
jgi:ribonucleoside-diphosphate reductase alpha chain